MNHKREAGQLALRALRYTPKKGTHPTGAKRAPQPSAIPLPVVHNPYLPRSTMRHTLRLLNMQYTPAELAAELDVTVHSVTRVWIPAGCPHERDASGEIWIVGTHFRAWAESGAVRRSLPPKEQR